MPDPHFAPGDRVVVSDPLGRLPDVTGTIVEAARPEWAHPGHVWVRFDPPASGDGNIHISLVRFQSAARERLTARVRELEAVAREVDAFLDANGGCPCMSFATSAPGHHPTRCPVGRLMALVPQGAEHE